MMNSPARFRRMWPAVLVLSLFSSASIAAQSYELPLIRRTEYGVPHILANDYHGIGIGLGYTQVEDYGDRIILGLLRSKGVMGTTFGRDSMQSDFGARRDLARVAETYHLLDAETRGVYEGFAEGVNIFIRTHPERVPAWAKPVFTGHDIAALDIAGASTTAAARIAQRHSGQPVSSSGDLEQPNPDDGSNAWAFAPSRTKSGRAILLRNPHLAWTSGYWEAHVTIPGKLNYYGDFRIGGPFAVVGGFNEYLGWATTNNAPDNDEVYVLDADTTRADHYIFDGVSQPLRRQDVTVEFSTPTGVEQETRSFWLTPLGPVVHRTRERVYIVRTGGDNEYRAGQQFLRMMRAQSLKEWKEALAMRARPTSNLTYADKAGNILYVWVGSVPSLPHPSGGDSIPIIAKRSADIWTSLVPTDSLPQVLNPKGGYVHNENDPPWYANLNAILDTLKYPSSIERPRLGLRSQHALELIHNKRKVSLEDVVTLKHSMRMLLADRVKPDLLEAIRASSSDAEVLAAADLLQKWDNTVAPESRGSLLFETWWRRYSQLARDSAYAEPWTPAKLTSTPRGLGKPAAAAEAFVTAIAAMKQQYGAFDVAWGDVHRVRRGNVDVPVGGCSGQLGCFRVLSYAQQPDGKRVANSGDGWVLAVEFGKSVPRAYSVLAYGQSPDPASPHHADQAEMFAKGQMKTVRFSEADIARGTIRAYRPGR
jgi:acyl-homoserine-lactone acylase